METASGTGSFPHNTRLSSTVSLSTSPIAFPSPSSSGAQHQTRKFAGAVANLKRLKPFATEDFKILLLENVNQTGRHVLAQQGYQVEFLKSSLPEDELIQRIRWRSSPFLMDRGNMRLTRALEMCMS